MIKIQETKENNFLIELLPNHSLFGWSRIIFLGSISATCLTVGVFFFFMGAPLILPFAGLEIGILLGCFYLSFRWSQQREMIYINYEKLTLERGRLIKEQSWEEFRTFAVLQVEIDRYENKNFSFQSKGKEYGFGKFLNQDDQDELQAELTKIIAKLNTLSPGL